MKHPCKKCLVRAACSKACDPWQSYAHNASQLMTFISIMFSAMTMGPLLLWLTHIGNTTNDEWPGMVLVFIWIFSFMAVTIIQAPYDKDEQISFLPRFTFAPFAIIWTVLIHSTKNYFKRA